MNSNNVVLIVLAMAAAVSFDCSARWSRSNKSVADVQADVDQDVARTASAGKRANAYAQSKGKKRVADAQSSRAKDLADNESDNARDLAYQKADDARFVDQRTYRQQFRDWRGDTDGDQVENMDNRTVREKMSDFFHGRN